MSDLPPPRICERCYSAIGRDEDHLRLAHLGWARPDGSIQWLDSFVHTTVCVPATAARETRRRHDAPSSTTL